MIITIPEAPRPFTVELNGRKYTFAAGEQNVPDDIGVLVRQALAKNAEPKTEPPFEVKDTVHTADLAPYAKTADLAPYAKTAEVMTKASGIEGYDAEKTQTLTNDSGALKWVDSE